MKTLLATGNPHKKIEFDRILQTHEILMPRDVGVAFTVEETGLTFLENALIKANALLRSVNGYPVIADDSGLVIPALDGLPGIHSARYGSGDHGNILTSEERNLLLLQNAAHLRGEERRAFFVCCLTLMVDEYRVFTVQETFAGYIGQVPCGTGGFGYDPIFYLPDRDCSVAVLTPEQKDAISHRGRAILRLKCIMDNLATTNSSS